MNQKNKIRFSSLIMMGLVLILTYSCKKDNNSSNTPTTPIANTVSDVEGNLYHTVTVGSQVWMVENLKTTKYRNGDPIPNVTDTIAWMDLTNGAYCNYKNVESDAFIYGRLYNRQAVMDSRNIAPIGWHIPTDTDWANLIIFLGGSSVAGGKLKESGLSHWLTPNTSATNETGFKAFGGGALYTGSYRAYPRFEYAAFWSSSDGSSNGLTHAYYLQFDDSKLSSGNESRSSALSVRCIKD